MTAFADARHEIRRRLAALGEAGRKRSPLLRRVPALDRLIEWAARSGYGSLGFVYLSAGVLTLLAATDRIRDAAGSTEATFWLAEQPFGRVWLFLLGVGLLAFVQWCILQSVFDADHAGTKLKGLMKRASHAGSGLFHGILAVTAFGLLDNKAADPNAAETAASQEKAAMVLSLPFGDWLLIAIGLGIIAAGVSNIINGLRADFTRKLSCSAEVCRRVAPLAKAGNVARGVSFIPLGIFVVLGGLNSQASEVRSFGAALDGLEAQPGGPWILAFTALGLMAYGAFSFVEARYRRIQPPHDLNPLN
ncbi:MAG TPA: DUF1206 domain-containing protein [Brevundimonas sp.]|nr:DUF1206 domain-containing protein [Brevundimonas sp.]